MLQVFKIASEFNPQEVDGTLLRTRAHESVYGAYTYEYQIKKGKLFISVMGRKLHEIIYDCPKLLPWTRSKRNAFLFDAYCSGGEWRQVLKNASGDLFQSQDDLFYAAWSKKNDTTSFGTMIFYEEKYRLVT